MSTISVASSTAHASPKQHILDAITAQAKAGKISSSDQTALDGAVDDIDTDLSNGSTTSSSSNVRLDPSQIKDRINTLIDGEVSNGRLTSDQAATLKDVFSKGGGGGQGGPGGPNGAGGPPPGSPPGGSPAGGASNDATLAAPGNAATSSGGASSASDVVTSFLKRLQETQSGSASYSTSGSPDNAKLASALLVNFQA